MGNMSYCRFQNTLADLDECADHMHDESLGAEETRARKKLIGLCVEIANEFGSEIKE